MTEKEMQQDIFNQAWLGMVKQNWKRSTTQDFIGCLYRSDIENRKCAIGHCIPDSTYWSGYEGKSADEEAIIAAIRTTTGESIPCITANSFKRWGRFLTKLQHCHDHAYNPEAPFRDFANEYELTIPE